MIKQLFLIHVIVLIGVSHAGAQLLQSLKSTAPPLVQHQTTGRPLVPSNTKPVSTEKFEHEFKLDPDGNFWLFWTVSGENITFETHVRTRGYIGFGLSPNGKMFPSDVVVGWVKADGTVHFQDCHTVGHYAPVVDASQDWHLLSGMENNFGTVLKFTRKLDTCDDKDTIITDNTIKAIYSYHPDDPVDMQSIQWHGVKRRGAQSIMFLSSTKSMHIPDDAIHVDMLSPNFHLPTVDTRYQCTIHKIPQLTKKHHMIRYEPLIEKKNIAYVHHIVITTCPDVTDADVGASFECYHRHTPRRFQSCSEIVVAWAVGGVAFNMPEHVGFPFGAADNVKYLRLEVHYNNPTMVSNIVDSSGIRMTLSPHLRQHDSGGISVGVSVTDTQYIPPYQKAFLSTGFCDSRCTSRNIPDNKSIKIFGLLQHAHLLGAGIKTRHIRNDIELSPVAEDDNYDFDYQDIRALKEEREVKRGDSFIVECTYDSSRRNKPTRGGLSTQEEMCLTFFYYYPKINMTACMSVPSYSQISKNPREATRQFDGWNWKDQNIQHMFQGVVNNSTHRAHCNGPDLHKWDQFISTVPVPKVPYQKPVRQCH